MDKIPIHKFAVELLNYYSSKLGCRAKTIGKIRGVVDELVVLADVRTTADLDDDAIRRFARGQPAGQAAGTYYTKLAALRAAMNHAVEAGLLDVAPAFPPIPQPGDRTPRSDPAHRDVTPGEVVRLLTYLNSQSHTWEGHRLLAAAATATFTDLLREELLRLELADFDLDRDRIRVPGRELHHRGASPAVLRIDPRLRPILVRWFPLAGPRWAFPNKTRSGPWTGGPTGTKPLERLREAGRAAGIERLTFEALRRFGAARLAPDLPPFMAPPAAVAEAAVITPARRRSGPGPFTLDDATRLMAYLKSRSDTWEGHRLYAWVGVGILVEVGRGEATHLRVDAIDLAGALVRIPRRTIPAVLVPDAVAILTDWIPRVVALADRFPRYVGSPWLFPGTKLVGPWTGGRPGSRCNDELREAGQSVGIEGLTFEGLRGPRDRHPRRVLLELGREFHATPTPTRTTDGPRPRTPGPAPGIVATPCAVRTAPARVAPTALMPAVPGPLSDVPTLVLAGMGRPVVVRGVVKPPPTEVQYRAIEALWDAGPNGLSGPQLNVLLKPHPGWRQSLTTLRRSDPDYAAVIHFGNRPYGRYRIEGAPPPAGFLQKSTELEP